eukprot:9893669-Karenia_brevis.AAC.1
MVRWNVVTGFALFEDVLSYCSLHELQKRFKFQVKSMCHLEKAAWIDLQADSLESCFSSGNMNLIYKGLQPIQQALIRKAKVRPVKRVIGSNGLPARSYKEERAQFREYFGALLDGSEVKFADLVRNQRDRYMKDLDCFCSWEDVLAIV